MRCLISIRPHVVCLDEPTNYLGFGGFAPFLYTCAWVGRIQLFFAPDTDTVELLKRAMRTFRGGFAVVSHNEKLIEEAGKSLHSVCMLPYIMLPFGFDLCLFGSFWEQEATRNKGHRY